MKCHRGNVKGRSIVRKGRSADLMKAMLVAGCDEWRCFPQVPRQDLRHRSRSGGDNGGQVLELSFSLSDLQLVVVLTCSLAQLLSSTSAFSTIYLAIGPHPHLLVSKNSYAPQWYYHPRELVHALSTTSERAFCCKPSLLSDYPISISFKSQSGL